MNKTFLNKQTEIPWPQIPNQDPVVLPSTVSTSPSHSIRIINCFTLLLPGRRKICKHSPAENQFFQRKYGQN